MARHSLDHFLSYLNHSLSSNEALSQYLEQAHALATVALLDGFMSCEPITVHGHLSVLEDLIFRAKCMLEGV